MYYNAVEKYLKSILGHYKIDKLNTITIQKMINDISSSGRNGKPLSLSSVKKFYITLSQAYEQAVRLNMIYKNPCDNIVLPKTEKKKAVAFSADEQERFLKLCGYDNTYGCLFIFAFNTGMRMGELFALMWDDIDFDNQTISVNKNLTVANDYSDNEHKQKTLICSTKTDSGEREIPMSKEALKVLKAQTERNQNNYPFVFYSTAGTPVT